MSLSNFIKYTGGGAPPRLYIFSSNSQATIIESPNDITQLALLTSGKSNNSISFLASYSNLGIYDRTGPLFVFGRSNVIPRLDTEGSLHTSNGYFIQNRVVINREAEVYSSNLFVETYAALSNLYMHDFKIQSATTRLELNVPSGYGHEFAFQYSGSAKTALKIQEQAVSAPRMFIGTTNSNVEVLTVNGRARIDRGMILSRPLGSNTLLLSDPSAPNDTIGSRMVVFREFTQNSASTFSGIGFDGGMIYTTASTDQPHQFMVTRDRPREVMRIGADTLGNPRVGIGFSTDTAPIAPLHVKGNSIFEGDLFVSGRFEGPENLATLDESGRLRVTDLPNRIPLLNSSNKIDDQYLPVANCNLNLYRSSLNVGIGTNSPKQKLHVAGNIYLQNGRLGVGTEAPSYPIHIQENSSTNALYYSYSAAGGDHFLLENSNTGGALAGSNTSSTNLCMVVTHDGRVGIQTRPDVGFDLHVNGAIKASELTIPTLSLDTMVASNILSGGLSTNTTLNGRPGATKLEGYTVSSERLGVVELTAYPDPDAGTIYIKNRTWMTIDAPYVAMTQPNELLNPVPLSRGETFRALSNLQGYTIQAGALSAFRISLLSTELSAAIPSAIASDTFTGTIGYQSDQLWPYVFSGLRELILGQDAFTTSLSTANTNTSNSLAALQSSNAALKASTDLLQSQVTILSSNLQMSSNTIVALESRVATLEQQMQAVLTQLSAGNP